MDPETNVVCGFFVRRARKIFKDENIHVCIAAVDDLQKAGGSAGMKKYEEETSDAEFWITKKELMPKAKDVWNAFIMKHQHVIDGAVARSLRKEKPEWTEGNPFICNPFRPCASCCK